MNFTYNLPVKQFKVFIKVTYNFILFIINIRIFF